MGTQDTTAQKSKTEEIKIYIADDEKIIRESIRDLIDWNRYGCQVTGVGKNGREVLEFVANQEVDLIISDICMPEMDGLELIKELAELDASLSVILISAYSSFDYIHQALQYDIVKEYLLKPINPADLIEAVQKAAEQLKARKHNAFVKELSDREAAEYAKPFFTQSKKEIAVLIKALKYHPAQSLYRDCIRRIQEQNLSLNMAKRLSIDLFLILNSELHTSHLSIHSAVSMEDVLYEIIISANFSHLTGYMISVFRNICMYLTEAKNKNLSSLMQSAMAVMEEKYSEPDFSLQSLADTLCVSNTYLSTKFKENTGTNFSRILNLMRMERAQQLLILPEYQISEVAAKCGIQDVRYFFKLFRKHTGQTPKEYRSFILYGRVMNCPSVARLLHGASNTERR